jgi:DNA-directed RNA polymerase subunit beta'
MFGQELEQKSITPGNDKKILYAATDISGTSIADIRTAAGVLGQHYSQWQLNPNITGDVLGVPKTNLDTEALAISAHKLIGISKGVVEPSTYDNIGHKQLLDPADLLLDSLNRSKAKSQGKMRMKIDSAEDVGQVINNSGLSKNIEKFFRNSGEVTGLSMRADQTNPLAMISGATQTTAMGTGGISAVIGSGVNASQLVHGSQIGFLDPIDTGEKKEAGLILPLPMGASKIGDRIVANMFDMKTKRMEKVDALVAYKDYVALPDDIKAQGNTYVAITKDNYVRAAVPGGKIERVPFSKIRYIIPSASQQFGIPVNLIPFLHNNNGNRMMMAAKHARQATALVSSEVPLVQVKAENGGTFEKNVGNMVAHAAKADGIVEKVDREQVVVRDSSGVRHVTYLYDRFVTTEKKTALNSTPLVKVGDSVKKGQIVADQTFTKNGTLALGTNLTVGFMPMKGYNFEDGVVISESAAKKLTSQHTYPIDVELAIPAGTIVKLTKEIESLDYGAMVAGKSLFTTWASVTAQRINLMNIGEDGIIKEGSSVSPGEPLVLAVTKTRPDQALSGMRGLTKRSPPQWKRAEVMWDKSVVGKVVKVVKNGRKVRILIETKEQMALGDKLVGRYGNKGVVTKILPDSEMPFTKQGGQGKALDVIMNPSGIPGRINPGQAYELAAAKIALKTGKTYEVKNFDSSIPDMNKKLLDELEQHGLSEMDDVHDPTEGYVGKIATGPMYIQKLVHQVDKKLGARGGSISLTGNTKYRITPDKQPARGDGTGGQSLSTLGIYALLGHNARMNIQELQTHKSTYEKPEEGQKGYNSDDYWISLMSGSPLPAPAPTFAYHKFVGHLKGMGVNVVKNGQELSLVPFTDKDLLQEKPHKIEDAGKMLVGTSGQPDKGGLFDFPDGGVDSRKWGCIKLAEPMPNPVMQTPIEVLLDLGTGGVPAVMRGDVKINGEVGGNAIKKALESIDVTKELESLKKRAVTLPASQRDKVYKKIKLLNNLQKLKLTPSEAYVNSYVPVMPPAFRPIGLSSGNIESADINALYKQLGMTNGLLETFDPSGLPEKRNQLRAQLYENLKNTYIDGMPTTRGDHISSLMQTIAKKEGGQSKDAMFQAKIIKRRSELSGRAVIVPEPALTLDEVGLPRKMAMEIYKPFTVRELGKMGYDELSAARLVETEPQNASVKFALEQAMNTRPVFIKRDPVLHKYSVMAFKPTVHEGKAMQIHPLVCKGFNADFDGDTMAVFLPASDKAVEEARKMMPSQNLFSSTSYKLMNVPRNEMVYGIFQMSEPGAKTNKTYPSVAAILEDFKAKKIGLKDQVTFSGSLTTAGKCMLYAALPNAVKAGPVGKDVLFGAAITNKRMDSILGSVAKEHKGDYPIIVDAWKNLGNKYATALGSSFSLKDFSAQSAIRDKHLAAADAEVAKLKNPTDAEKADIYKKAANTIVAEVQQAAKESGNSFYKWTAGSGALGKWNQVTQMIASPLVVMGGDGKVVPDPIRKSYSEGLSTADYWTAVNGVRTGTISRAKETQDPGAQAKRIMNLSINLPISETDCGTARGAEIATSDDDAEGRYLAKDAGPYKIGELITPTILLELRKSIPSVTVRSPLKCEMLDGLCSKCCGLNEDGQLHAKGANIGVVAGQALSEPLTQMTMNSFHTGGSALGAGASSAGNFEAAQNLFNMVKPESMRVKATITKVDGKITRIYDDTVAGGKFVVVEDTTYRVPQGIPLKVKVGDIVKKGQPLSAGPISPHELLEATDMDQVRSYLVDSLQEVYSTSGVRRRNVETVVRNLTNTVKVVEDPAFEYSPDEVISETAALKENAERLKMGQPALKYKAVVKGIDEAVMAVAGYDWLARMNHIELENTIRKGVAHGYLSKIHGANPLAGIAYGAEFGDGEDWEY